MDLSSLKVKGQFDLSATRKIDSIVILEVNDTSVNQGGRAASRRLLAQNQDRIDSMIIAKSEDIIYWYINIREERRAPGGFLGIGTGWIPQLS